MNKDFYFNFSVSTKPYDRNRDDAAYIKWHETNGTITTLSKYISEGFAYCNCFNHKEGTTFGNTLKKGKNVKSANLICLDLDAVRLTYHEFVTLMEQTEIMPNIVYTTQNNGHFKTDKETYNNRYRAIYVIDEPIYNDTLYKEVHQALKNEVRIITEDKNIFNDNTDNNISHFFAGCKGTSITTDGNIYSLSWLMERYDISADNGKATRNNNKKGSDTRTNNKGKNTTQQSDTRTNNKDDDEPQNGVKHTYVTDYFRRKLNEFQSDTRYNKKRQGGVLLNRVTLFQKRNNDLLQIIIHYHFLTSYITIYILIHLLNVRKLTTTIQRKLLYYPPTIRK